MITYSIERILDKELEKGRSEGLSKGLEKGVRALVETCRELGLSYEETLNKLILRLDYDNERAEKAMDKYWKE